MVDGGHAAALSHPLPLLPGAVNQTAVVRQQLLLTDHVAGDGNRVVALVVVGGGGGQRVHQIAPQTGGKVHHHRQKGDNGNGFCYKVALSHGLLGLPFSPSQSETSTARMGMMVEMACL